MFNNFFPKFVPFFFWDNVDKYGRAIQAPDDNIIRPMRTACWIPKATNTHSEYVILIAFPRQQWSRERVSYLSFITSFVVPSGPCQLMSLLLLIFMRIELLTTWVEGNIKKCDGVHRKSLTEIWRHFIYWKSSHDLNRTIYVTSTYHMYSFLARSEVADICTHSHTHARTHTHMRSL